MNGSNNAYYMNRIIKLISPLTCQTFKIELNGEENELRELLATILEINPKSIKGLRDSYNNYYTLSSAVKNPHINTDPYNYYTVVIKGIVPNHDLKYMKYPSFNIFKRDRINSFSNSNDSGINYRNNLINKTLDYYNNDEDVDNANNLGYLYHKNNNIKNDDYYNNKEFLKFAEDLYKKNYIDYNLERKLKKLIKENNKEVISILNSYLKLNSNKSFDELAKKIQPVITSGSKKSENLEESKQNSSSSPSENSKSSKKEKKSKKNKDIKDNKDNKEKINNKKKNINKKQEKQSDEEKILDDVKLNFSKEKYLKLKELLEKKDKEIIKIIKAFEKNNDYNHLLSKLSRLVDNLEENSEEDIIDEENISGNENDSSYYIRKEDNESSDTKNKNKKNKKNKDNEEIQKISKNVYNSLKNKGKDLYYIAKYDMQQLKNDEKKNLFVKQFKLDIDKLNKDNYKIPKKNISIIKKYYTDYILKKICKNFNEDEKLIYNRLLEEEDEENNIIIQYYKDLLNHQNITELRNQLKKIIKEAEERIEEEENEDDEEENKGKNSIKEENEENEDEEDEEEEDDGEGEEEEEDEAEENEDNQEEKNNSKKDNDKDSDKDNDSSSNNKDNFILNDVNKDRAVNMLNNNYKKINNFNNFSNFANINNNNNKDNNSEDSEEKKEEKKEEKNDNQNLGLGFVVVKQKKTNNREEKKESFNNFQNNNNKLNTTNSIAKESSQSTNNPNKKLNQFIKQIEHMKKIDDIKKTIIDAIHSNNKYIMELFEKFQKNKFNLNPKSLNVVYKQIKDNPDTKSKDYIFKSLIKEIPNLSENIQDFICDEFINKNQELETYFSLYENTKEKDEFFESLEMFLKKPNTKKNLIKFSLKKIKTEISSTLLKKGENDNNEDLALKSKEIIKILKKYNLFNEKEYNIIMNSLDNDDDVFTATFQVLFDDQDLNEFYETMTLALDNQMKKDGINENEEKWNNDLIRKNYKEIKKKIEEKHYNTLEELFKNKNENLYNILKDLNSSNINEKIESAKTLILKKELSAT